MMGLKQISKAVLPFVGASLLALLLTTYIPFFAMGIPSLLG